VGGVRRIHWNKSFLLLFFKKDASASAATYAILVTLLAAFPNRFQKDEDSMNYTVRITQGNASRLLTMTHA